MSRVGLSAVLPTFCEADNIVPLLRDIETSLAGLSYEILVVDDDSPDGTARRVEEYATQSPAVRLVRRVNVRGLTSAIQEGIDRSAGEAVVWLDADRSMPAEIVPRLYAALARGDVAVASRYLPGGVDARADVPLHRLLSWALNAFARRLLGSEITDYTSGFICAKRAVLHEIRLCGDYGEYCIDLLHRARKRGYTVIEVPYQNAPRAAGESKTASSLLGFLRRGWRYVTLTVRLRRELGG
jgi:dolichol-phosphate mannosyltransferase